jgi:uncharacterized protein YbaR (Trm112 family)
LIAAFGIVSIIRKHAFGFAPEACLIVIAAGGRGGPFSVGRHSLDKKLLDILACPVCKGPLVYDKTQQELICRTDRLAYPIRDDIPVMLEEEARQLPAEEDI